MTHRDTTRVKDLRQALAPSRSAVLPFEGDLRAKRKSARPVRTTSMRTLLTLVLACALVVLGWEAREHRDAFSSPVRVVVSVEPTRAPPAVSPAKAAPKPPPVAKPVVVAPVRQETPHDQGAGIGYGIPYNGGVYMATYNVSNGAAQ